MPSIKEWFLLRAIPSLNALKPLPDDIHDKHEKFRRHIRARYALQEFIRCVDGEPYQDPNPATMFYLAEAFKEILNGVDANKALCLKKSPGRGPGARGPAGCQDNPDEESNRIRMVADVIVLRQLGESYQEAVEIVAEENQLSESTIYRAYRDKRQLAIRELARYFETTTEVIEKQIKK